MVEFGMWIKWESSQGCEEEGTKECCSRAAKVALSRKQIHSTTYNLKTVGQGKSYWFQVETTVEDVQQNGKHQQHRPGQEDGATVEDGSLHRENKGFKGISGPHVLL